MQLTMEVLSSIRVGVAAISVLVSVFLAVHALNRAHRKEPLPLQASSIMASLLILNGVLGLPGLAINNSNSTLLIVNIAAIVSLLGALNLFVWRASRGNHA